MATHSFHTHTGMSVNWCIYHFSYSVLSFTLAPFRMQQSSAFCDTTFWQYTRFFMSPHTQKSTGLKPGDHGCHTLAIDHRSLKSRHRCVRLCLYIEDYGWLF